MKADELEMIRSAAHAYVRGESEVAPHYKSAIEALFQELIVILWPFLNIVVKSGATLEFGTGTHKLVAHKLTIESGGRVRSYGNLVVDCTLLEGQKRVVRQFPPHVLASSIRTIGRTVRPSPRPS
jgi:hypothetical protein